MFLESSFGFEESVELSSSDERHNKEKPQVRHEEVLHSNQELVLTFEHDVFLKFGVLDLVIFKQNILSDDFDCVKLFIELKFSQEYFTKCAFSKNEYHFEIIECWFSLSRFCIICCFDQYGGSHFINKCFVGDTAFLSSYPLGKSLHVILETHFVSRKVIALLHISGIGEVEIVRVVLNGRRSQSLLLDVLLMRHNFLISESCLFSWHVIYIILWILMILHKTFILHAKHLQRLVVAEVGPSELQHIKESVKVSLKDEMHV